jgi:hypothetical protein
LAIFIRLNFFTDGKYFNFPDHEVLMESKLNARHLADKNLVPKTTWFDAEKFCRKRGWLLGELLTQNAEKEFARQTQGQLGCCSKFFTRLIL